MPGVSDSFLPLIVATVAFVASHFVLSAMPVRGRLVRAAGEPVFLIGYSLVAFVTFGWMCIAYARAPFEDLWGDPLWARWLAVLVMPLATVLLVAGYRPPTRPRSAWAACSPKAAAPSASRR